MNDVPTDQQLIILAALFSSIAFLAGAFAYSEFIRIIDYLASRKDKVK